MPIDTPEVEPRSHVGNWKSSISYKESLIGVIPGAYESAFFGSSMEEDGGDVSEEEEDDESPEDGEVVIKLTRIEKEEVVTHSRIRSTKGGGNLKKVSTSWIKPHSRRS